MTSTSTVRSTRQRSITFLCADPMVSMTIGRGGQTIKKISSECDCSIIFDDSIGTIRTMNVAGSAASIGNACRIIAEMMCRRDARDLDDNPENNAYLFIMVIPENLSGSIIGKSGENVKNIRSSTNASLKIIDRHGSPYNYIFLEGNPDQLQKVIEMVTNICFTVSDETTDWNVDLGCRSSILSVISPNVAEIFDVDIQTAKRIIGKGGKMANRLRHYSGARINIETDPRNHSASVRIFGQPSCVELCKKMIDLELGDVIVYSMSKRQKPAYYDFYGGQNPTRNGRRRDE